MIGGGLNVEVVQTIAASPATVFSYLVEPLKFSAWMGVRAELDPHPGGRVRIDVDGEHVALGEFREVDPPYRVVMTWGWENHDSVPPGSTIVEITLTPQGDGTILRLRQTGLPSEIEWDLSLSALNVPLTRAGVFCMVSWRFFATSRGASCAAR
jgi:uncharacterized protein YndB with AHSA1/START domain